MFGSDWPVCLRAATYDRVLEAAQSLLADLDDEDRTRIFSTNANEFYRLQQQAQAA
jgi:L-fuconolactonase